MARAIPKYLARVAEPEAKLAERVAREYDRALVVPACRERPELLDGFRVAAETSSGSTLVILVVNGRVDAPAIVHEENARTLAEILSTRVARRLSPEGATPVWQAAGRAYDLLVVDRASDGHRFPPKQGVGLARKIGADVALALYERGRLGRFAFFADADVRLPRAHFDGVLDAPGGTAFVSFPFWHEAQGDAEVDRATALYELSLRYYVAGLAWAGSPYAFHTLGSSIAVDLPAYAAVRGVPKREAGEDFYLVNKIAKVGACHVAPRDPVVIRARRSDRTPFGTGNAVARLGSADLLVYDPRCFEGLGLALAALDRFAAHRTLRRLRADLDSMPPPFGSPVAQVLTSAGADDALPAMARSAPSDSSLRAALHRWFDGFRALKLVHALTASHFPKRSWRAAFAAAPFAPDPGDDLDALRRSLAAREAWRGRAP